MNSTLPKVVTDSLKMAPRPNEKTSWSFDPKKEFISKDDSIFDISIETVICLNSDSNLLHIGFQKRFY